MRRLIYSFLPIAIMITFSFPGFASCGFKGWRGTMCLCSSIVRISSPRTYGGHKSEGTECRASEFAVDVRETLIPPSKLSGTGICVPSGRPMSKTKPVGLFGIVLFHPDFCKSLSMLINKFTDSRSPKHDENAYSVPAYRDSSRDIESRSTRCRGVARTVSSFFALVTCSMVRASSNRAFAVCFLTDIIFFSSESASLRAPWANPEAALALVSARLAASAALPAESLAVPATRVTLAKSRCALRMAMRSPVSPNINMRAEAFAIVSRSRASLISFVSSHKDSPITPNNTSAADPYAHQSAAVQEVGQK